MIFPHRRFRLKYLPALLPLFFLAACDEFGLLEESTAEPLIHISDNEGIINPGTEVGLWTESAEIAPESVSARLENRDGFASDLVVKAPADGWGSPAGNVGGMIIPDSIPEGLFTLVTEAWSDEKLLAEERRDLYVIRGDWTIKGFELFPPEAVSGGLFYAAAVTDIPEGSEVWLRWILDEDLAAEGYRSEGWDEVVLHASESPGMSTLRLEIYLGSPEGDVHPISSSSTELYTVESLPPGKDNLGPPDSYVLLQHFDGTLGDDTQIVGTPRPVYTDEGMGFHFTDGDGLVWQDVPLDRNPSGEWPIFSLTFGILPDSETDGRLLEIAGSGDSALTVSITQGRAMTLIMAGEERYEAGFLMPGRRTGLKTDPTAVTISYVPEDEGSRIFWLVDGDTAGSEFWSTTPSGPGESLRISIGGESGFSGLLTEFALRLHDAEPDRFAFYRDHDEEMKIAEGFEDKVINSDIRLTDPVKVSGGALLLAASSSLQFPGGSGGTLAIGKPIGGDGVEMKTTDPRTGEILKHININSDFFSDSPGRILIPLEKAGVMSDNEAEVFYELRTFSRNESDIRIEYILVERE